MQIKHFFLPGQPHRRYRCILIVTAIIAFFMAGFLYHNSKIPEYIFLMNGIRNYGDFSMFQGFEAEIEKSGGKAIVLDFEDSRYSAIRQIQELQKAVTPNTVCIIANGASTSSLTEELTGYHKKGISILSCISEVEASCRLLHLSPSDSGGLGKSLLSSSADSCSGKGSFAIISSSSQTESVTSLIQHIRYAYEDDRYPDMLMADILYTSDSLHPQKDIEKLLKQRADVTSLICLSESATANACAAVQSLNLENKVAIIGIADPDYMASFPSDSALRTKFFYYDMKEFGIWTAQVAEKLVSGALSGTAGEHMNLSGHTYTIQKDSALSEESFPGTVLYRYPHYEYVQSDNFLP